MGKDVRGFIRFDKAWYAESNGIRNPEINVGIYDTDDEGCVAEFIVAWHELGGKLIPQLQIFSDAWKMFAGMKDFIDELAKYDRQDISADTFCGILLSLSFKDLTEYETPEKYRNGKRINFIDSHYNPLFSVEDGGEIEIEIEPGKWEKAVCNYIDEYHFHFCFGKSRCVYHVFQFAQNMESNGSNFRKAKE
jgi:hypothetical protein